MNPLCGIGPDCASSRGDPDGFEPNSNKARRLLLCAPSDPCEPWAHGPLFYRSLGDMSCARREDSFIPLTWLNPRGTRWGIRDQQQLSGNGNELDGCDSCWQSEADERRPLGNRGRVCNREPNLPRFCRAFLAVSLRIDSRSETLRVEGHCRLHRHHAHRQRHHGKPEHLDRLSVRALLLHRWTRTQGLPGTAPDRTILRLVWLPCLGAIDRRGRRSSPEVATLHRSRGFTGRVVHDGCLGPFPRPDCLHHPPELDLDPGRRILWRADLQLPWLVLHRVCLPPAFRTVRAAEWVGCLEPNCTLNPLSPGHFGLLVDKCWVPPELPLSHQHAGDRCSRANVADW